MAPKIDTLRFGRQWRLTPKRQTIFVPDVVEAPRRLTLTFGGSTQERRGREHKVVERGGYGSTVWHNAVVKARKGCAHEGCGQKSSKIELIE